MRSSAALTPAVFMVLALGCPAPPESDDSASGSPTTNNPSSDSDSASESDSETEDASESNGSGLDAAQLDREAEGGACGYPSGGDNGYGTNVGDRVANTLGLNLKDCNGDDVEFSDFMCPELGNKGILINIGAGWCGPCQEETREFPELYEEYHDQGIEFVQVLFQDWTSQTPTTAFCEEWSTGDWEGGEIDLDLQFPVVIDQLNDWTQIYLQDPAAATPINLLIDANGNIRWKSEGQLVGAATLRTQFDAVIAEPYEIP